MAKPKLHLYRDTHYVRRAVLRHNIARKIAPANTGGPVMWRGQWVWWIPGEPFGRYVAA